MDVFIGLLGRLHPAVVHFPIALLVTAAGLALWRRGRGMAPHKAVPLLVHLGAGSAVLAAGLGLFWAATETRRGSEAAALADHRNAALAATFVAVAASALYARFEAGSRDMLKLVVLSLAAGLVGSGAHLGGTLVFGDDHYASALGSAGIPPADDTAAPTGDAGNKKAEEKPPEPKKPEDEAPAQKVDFNRDILPLLEKSCLKCHKADKKKGDLRLDTKAHAMKGGESGKVILPGDGAGSKLYQLTALPDDDEDLMPAKGDRLSEQQQLLLKRWIDEGAHWPE